MMTFFFFQGVIFYRDTDIETTRDDEATRNREEITRGNADDSHDFEQSTPSYQGGQHK